MNNEYYDQWIHQITQLQMPPVISTDTNESGPYWTIERGANIYTAGRNTRTAFSIAAGISAVDGPLPFVDVAAFTAATLYSAAWWTYALS